MKKILIVEDEISIAELQRDYLEVAGYEVTIELDGKRGLSLMLEQDFDLIVLDIMLPGMDGFEICRSLRKQKDTPVLFVSAKRDDIDKIRGLGLGADDYMTKPFSPGELVARVSAHITRYDRLTSKPHDEAPYELVIKNLKICPASRKVFVSDKEITLANKEFELLAFLAQNPNRVYSKDQLLNSIWGLDAFVENATVTVHINRLREKIENDPSAPEFIETVWGAGYRFVV